MCVCVFFTIWVSFMGAGSAGSIVYALTHYDTMKSTIIVLLQIFFIFFYIIVIHLPMKCCYIMHIILYLCKRTM